MVPGACLLFIHMLIYLLIPVFSTIAHWISQCIAYGISYCIAYWISNYITGAKGSASSGFLLGSPTSDALKMDALKMDALKISNSIYLLLLPIGFAYWIAYWIKALMGPMNRIKSVPLGHKSVLLAH